MHSTDPSKAVLDRLIAIQERDGLTTEQMATSLGMSRNMWWRLRSGSRSFGIRTLQSAFRAYPELAILYTQALPSVIGSAHSDISEAVA